MAAKITILDRTPHPSGSFDGNAIYWYDLTGANTIMDGRAVPQKVIPQTRANLNTQYQTLFTETDLSALDQGNAGFEFVRVVQSAGESGAAIAIRLRADHTARQTWWIADQKSKYAALGTGIN
jgi:hypothetical protein